MTEDTLLAEHVYRETCSDIRATDDISFKLMVSLLCFLEQRF